MHKPLIQFIQDVYGTKDFIALHEPVLGDREIESVSASIKSGYVSSAGKMVDEFSNTLASTLGAKHAVPLVSGTSALHLALYLNKVSHNDLVVCPALTFVATCNAVRTLGADPLFIDVNRETMGLCPTQLSTYLDTNAYVNDQGLCIHRGCEKPIRACIAVHTLGHCCDLNALRLVCERWSINLIEDAAQALGSKYHGDYVGSNSRFACFSFNGNKIVTTGGGGALVSCDNDMAKKIKHISSTARVLGVDIDHDEFAFNYRMPNLNAALGYAQLTRLQHILIKKRNLAKQYQDFFCRSDYDMFIEPYGRESNYWLNAMFCEDASSKRDVLDTLNAAGIGARPLWKLMTDLPMYAHCERGELSCSKDLYERTVCLPSSVHVPMMKGVEGLMDDKTHCTEHILRG